MKNDREDKGIVAIKERQVQICDQAKPERSLEGDLGRTNVTINVGTLVNVASDGGVSTRWISALITRIFGGQQ